MNSSHHQINQPKKEIPSKLFQKLRKRSNLAYVKSFEYLKYYNEKFDFKICVIYIGNK